MSSSLSREWNADLFIATSYKLALKKCFKWFWWTWLSFISLQFAQLYLSLGIIKTEQRSRRAEVINYSHLRSHVCRLANTNVIVGGLHANDRMQKNVCSLLLESPLHCLRFCTHHIKTPTTSASNKTPPATGIMINQGGPAENKSKTVTLN